ncbi:molybdopterin biosynthesis protein [Desulfovibrio mangrovi]|uniref:molybdopterin biosynthesis protein n=1 Tax=Desulfovibrio mangrovi TaxID=2976983 RepID=UPI0022481FE4|nr:molybdopterin biosynthesis protein [Desulfovibrio mangrovi]UZP66145.1 molybdopterin biosynthesis protein [Desulfovibrio mangrovi]
MTSPKRNVYLKTIPIPEAVEKARAALDRDQLMRPVSIPVHEAAGRVLSEAVFARFSSPTFHSAAMDGYAVNAKATFGAREGSPLVLTEGRDCIAVNTGNPLPEGCDAVIMIENVTRAGEAAISIEAPAFPWQHVRRIGEDIVATELLFPQNHRISPYDIGALLSAGIWDVSVWEPVRIAIIPTGDEVLDFTTRPTPKAGQVVESNSQVLAALARQLGCEVQRIPPVADKREALQNAVNECLASAAHIVIICAGSSAGSKDFTRSTIESCGEVLVHGISAMPGKPSLLGTCKGKLVAGAPGYPVSAIVCFEELIAPIISWLGRAEHTARRTVPVELTRKAPSKLGVEEFLRLSVGKVGDKYVATPLARGAGCITTVSKAQALTRIPVQSEGLEQGGTVRAELMVPENELNSILVCVGSHDNTLDILADELMGFTPPIRLTSSHVGSMGGILATKSGSCHFAGAHLFDPDSGDYNFPFLERYLPNADVTLVNLAIRHQGFMVPKGNPKGIRSIHDLADGSIRFMNRQRGAGTRILFDHHLREAEINPAQVTGYDKEEFTHMAVAVNVLTGATDTGLGIYAAAKALDLDFVPLARERYDLIIPNHFMETAGVQAVLRLLASPTFHARIEALGGYETTLTGQIMKPGTGLGE